MADEATGPGLMPFVEEMGNFFEGAALPRMAGRILGWLLVCDPPHPTFAELREALRASKGSISTMTRLLVGLGVVERITLPGDRRSRYRVHGDAWTRLLRERTQTVSETRRMAERGLQLLAGESPERRERLRRMHELYAWWEREAFALLDRWEREHAAPPHPPRRGA